MIYDHPLVLRVYGRSPIFVQHAMVSAYGLTRLVERINPVYRRYRAEVERSQWWSPGDLRALQEERLRGLIAHAYENVPYYRRVFDERKLKPADIRTAADLYKLPILNKLDLRRHRADLCARNIPANQYTSARTGGSTGIPVIFHLDKNRLLFDHALTHRFWAWAGFHFDGRVLVLRPLLRAFQQTEMGVFWRYAWPDDRLFMSSDFLNHRTGMQYVEKILEWQPKYLTGFSSSILALARYLDNHGLQIPLKACFPSSELLTPQARQVIERSFACRAWDRYGSGERLAVGQQCEHGNYHQNPEFGILQVDWPKGTPAPAGQRGEIIQTGLTNLSMPLIRYAIGDLGALSEAACPCGRGLPLMGQVEGRTGENLITPEGRLIPAVHLAGYYAKIDKALRCQIIQKRVGEAILRVQPEPGFSNADAAKIVRSLQERIGPTTHIHLELVDDLQAPLTSKFRYFVSEVDTSAIPGYSRLV